MRPVRPTTIRLEASSVCQLRCPLCPIHSGVSRPAIGIGFLRLTDFENLLRENPDVTTVELANYGEMFLNPQLLEIMRCAHERGVALTATEGVNLNDAKPEVLEGLVKYRFARLTCSIDGATDEVYRKYRVHGSLQAVLAHIETINLFKERYRSKLPRLLWQFIVFGHNEHEIAQARRLAGELGMEFCLKLNWKPEFSPVKNEEALRRAIGAASVSEYQRLFGRHYDALNCHRLWTEPQINWDGRVLGCTRNFWGEFGGNAFEDGLDAAVNSEGMRYAREMLLGRAPARDGIPCSSCDIYLGRRAEGKWVAKRSVEPSAVYRGVRAVYHAFRERWVADNQGDPSVLYRSVRSVYRTLRAVHLARRDPDRSESRLHSRVYSLKVPSKPRSDEGWENYEIFRGSTRGVRSWSCHVTTQSPGVRPHPLHKHRREELVLPLAGELDVILPGATSGTEERRVSLRPGQVVYYPASFVHTVETTGEETARYVVLEWSNRRRTCRPDVKRFGVFDLVFDEEVNDGFVSRLVFAERTRYLQKLQCHTTIFTPGRGQDSHVDRYDVALVFLRGEVETLGDRTGMHEMALYANGEAHGMRNTGSETVALVALELHGLTAIAPVRLALASVSLAKRARRKTAKLLRRGRRSP